MQNLAVSDNGILNGMDKEKLLSEFDRQTNILLEKGYPKTIGMSQEEFLGNLSPLKSKLNEIAPIDNQAEHYPFLIIVKNDLISAEKAMGSTEKNGKKGLVNMTPVNPDFFKPIEGVTIPEKNIYLLIDIDTGKETLNKTPNEGLEILKQQQRTPLTIDEGIALFTYFPEVLKKNHCYYMLASRGTDRKVPALWISYGSPRLGWCWAGNPHTWLGSASASQRIG